MASFADKHGGYCTCTREKCTDDCATYRRFKPKPITNADRIRAMTDEELASLLMYFADDTGEIDEKDYDAFCNMEWRERMLRWLKQEIKK